MANEPLESIKFPGIADKFTVPAVDNTLTVPGAVADAKAVGDEISDIKADLNDAFGSGGSESLIPLAYTQTGYYIALDGTTVDLNSPIASVFGHAYIVTDCSEGEQFIVNAKGGGKPRAWGFINAQNAIIDVAESGVTVENLRLVAPAGAVKLIIDDNTSPNTTSYRVITQSKNNGIMVRYDVEQTHTEAEKARARRNIGVYSGLSDEAKTALLACFEHVAWIGTDGRTYYDALETALNKTPTPPTPIIEPIYMVTSGTVFNGTSDFIDTNLQLMGEAKTNLTIVFDVLDKSVTTQGNKTLLHCMHEDSPWPGVCIQFVDKGSGYKKLNFDVNSNTSASRASIQEIPASDNGVREKFVGIIDFQSGTSKLLANVDNVDYTDSKSLPSDVSSTIVSENALIGCYQTTSGTKGRFWKGTIYDFKIYNYAWTEAEANAYLQEDHS